MAVANEYADGGGTYPQLSDKYNFPKATIATWVLKHKKYNVDPQMNVPQRQAFLNVTEALVATNRGEDEVTVTINGFELKSDLNTLLRLLQGAKHV